MNDIQAAVNTTTQEATKVLTDADVGLDAAALAADNIAGTTKLADAETAAQEIMNLKSTVDELKQTIADMQPVFAAAKTFIDSSPELLKLKDDVESALSDFEADLPEGWKAGLNLWLQHSKCYFGI